MAFDAFFKRVMRESLGPSCETQEDKPVGVLPLKMEMIVRCTGPPAQATSIPLLAERFATENAFEYKSGHDAPKKQDIVKLLGYLCLYCDQQGIGIDEVPSRFTAWYIIVKRPHFVDDLARDGLVSSNPDSWFIRVEHAGSIAHFSCWSWKRWRYRWKTSLC